MKKPVVLGILFAILVAAALVYTSLNNTGFRVQVCVAYEGRHACRIASAARKEAALRAAQDNACAQIASGVTATMVCTGAPPENVKWLR